jgi:hypothetical protein
MNEAEIKINFINVRVIHWLLSKPPARLDKIPFPIKDLKWQRALNSDYLLFFSPQEGGEKAGLYYAQIDFSKAGRKEPNKLLDLISENENMKLIEDLKLPKKLLVWDVGGNDHVLAVAYSVLGKENQKNKTTSKLMVLTSQEGSFVECDNVDHSGYDVNVIKVIVPFEDNDITHVIYGLSGGVDVNGH